MQRALWLQGATVTVTPGLVTGSTSRCKASWPWWQQGQPAAALAQGRRKAARPCNKAGDRRPCHKAADWPCDKAGVQHRMQPCAADRDLGAELKRSAGLPTSF